MDKKKLKKAIKTLDRNPIINWNTFYQEFARRGGLSKSKKKAEAARRNGKLGGRPRGKSKAKK